MTLGDGKRKVLMLLDEYSSGGTLTVDEDINAKMNDFFDIAQKDMARWQPVLRVCLMQLDGTGDQTLPEDVGRVLHVSIGGNRVHYRAIDGRLRYTPGDTSTVELEYFAAPETITPETADSYEFEVSEEAASCLPFFVAAQQLIVDLVVDYGAFWNMYVQLRGMLDRSANCGGAGMRQRLWS